MSSTKKMFEWKRRVAPQTTINGMELSMESQALRVQSPGGGFVWNRPTAIVVHRDGREERVVIRDVTRQTQVILLAFSLLFTLLGVAMQMQRSDSNGNEHE